MQQQISAELGDFRLPRYHEIPDVGLYLDQTVKYINRYLEPLGCMELTASMVSNMRLNPQVIMVRAAIHPKRNAFTEANPGVFSQINEQVITKGGNYVLYLRYETADGTPQMIVLATALTNSRPNLTVDAENRLVVTCEDESIINFRVFVYYLGEQTVADIYDESALEKLAGKPTAYWGLNQIGKAVLIEPGTYVAHLQYNVDNGGKETVALKVTITENDENNDAPEDASLFLCR